MIPSVMSIAAPIIHPYEVSSELSGLVNVLSTHFPMQQYPSVVNSLLPSHCPLQSSPFSSLHVVPSIGSGISF